MRAHINNVWAVIIADGNISKKELKRLLVSANDVYDTLKEIDGKKIEVTLCPEVAKTMQIDKWTDLLNEELKLTPPTNENINDWLNVVDSWFNYFGNAFDTLRHDTLETLLVSEAHVEQCYLNKIDPGDAPAAAVVPKHYKVLLPEAERKLQTKLGWWDRFQTADGFFPGVARLTVAGAVFGSIFFFGIFAGTANVTIYNGLSIPVTVSSNKMNTNVRPFSTSVLEVTADELLKITTTTLEGELIEKFNTDASNSLIEYVYNVASAGPLIEWTEIYGEATEKPARYLGATRWVATKADHLFTEPPKSVETSSKGTTRDILTGFGEISPDIVQQYLPEDTDIQPLVVTHATWDDSKSTQFLQWLESAISYPEIPEIMKQRLQRNPDEIITLRVAQDIAEKNNSNEICDSHITQAKSLPENLDWQYLSTRCIQDESKKLKQYLSYNKQHPEHPWFGLAAGFTQAEMGNWDQALSNLKIIYADQPALGYVIADPMIRILRISGKDKPLETRKLLDESKYLRDMTQIETGEDITDDYIKAYHLLAIGELDKAVELAESLDEYTLHYILRLAAASDGTSEKIIKTANALTLEQSITTDTYWQILALAIKNKADTGPLLELIKNNPAKESKILLTFLKAIEKPVEYNNAEKILAGLSPRLRGHAYSMGLIIQGKSAPVEWRDAVKELLFSAERPYFL